MREEGADISSCDINVIPSLPGIGKQNQAHMFWPTLVEETICGVLEKGKSISLSEVKCIVCRFPIDGGAEYILQYSIFSALYCKM